MRELSSAVLILRPNQPKIIEGRFLGRVAHKLFLTMLNQVGYDDLAQQLHDLNGPLPFTVSDLLPHSPTHYWLRITGLNEQLGEILTLLPTQLTGQTLLIPPRVEGIDTPWALTVEMILLSHHEWARQTTYADLVRRHWQTPRKIALEFFSPTTLKSLGVQRVFPDASLIFRLLYDRWLKLTAQQIPLPFSPSSQDLEQFVSYFVQIDDYELRCMTIPLKNSAIKSFHGWAAYRLLPDNDDFRKRAERRQSKHGDVTLLTQYHAYRRHRDQYAAVLTLLSEFAFYSGLGNHTGQGMGMVRRKN
ncbi:MAG: CRISPR system precrRNA processing endoribonuclease RAMP protein Cas6 [Anaerolineae bacterium]|jgi:CRISPR/Cas system endoribonuclease Cas6 (RAMP superfamily)|nr:CRISPR system precrRNA processing endoribonuclease RAMP protein Cas6 [Anaerolineae bacterium]